MRKSGLSLASTILVLFAASLARSEDSVPLVHWQAPPYWVTAPTKAESAPHGGLPTKTSQTPLVVSATPIPFLATTPCRLADTRATSGFPAGYGPPSLAGGHVQRTFIVAGQCGIPSNAEAVSFNFTVWAPTTRGDLRAFPAGALTPASSVLNWEANILALANAAVVRLGTGGSITVQVDGPGTIDLIIDVNGYYIAEKTAPVKFIISLFGIFPSPSTGGPGPDPYIGEIRMFAGNFAPNGWALCNGQLLPISQNTALFSLLGTTYGGDGQTTFALPNLNGGQPTGY